MSLLGATCDSVGSAIVRVGDAHDKALISADRTLSVLYRLPQSLLLRDNENPIAPNCCKVVRG